MEPLHSVHHSGLGWIIHSSLSFMISIGIGNTTKLRRGLHNGGPCYRTESRSRMQSKMKARNCSKNFWGMRIGEYEEKIRRSLRQEKETICHFRLAITNPHTIYARLLRTRTATRPTNWNSHPTELRRKRLQKMTNAEHMALSAGRRAPWPHGTRANYA